MTGALLDRCVITKNLVTNTRGCIALMAGAAADFEDCTVSLDSTKAASGTAGIYSSGAATLRNTIVWGLRPVGFPVLQLGAGGTVGVSYSDIAGGWAGTGNINADPLFCNATGGSFTLSGSSPCLGSGHDGTTIGAFEAGCTADVAWTGAATRSLEGDAATPSHTGLLPGVARSDAPIRFALATGGPVSLDVFAVSGARVASLVQGAMAPGTYSVAWGRTAADGSRAPAGIYLIRFVAGEVVQSRRICLVR